MRVRSMGVSLTRLISLGRLWQREEVGRALKRKTGSSRESDGTFQPCRKSGKGNFSPQVKRGRGRLEHGKAGRRKKPVVRKDVQGKYR